MICNDYTGYSYMALGRKGLEEYSRQYSTMTEAWNWYKEHGKELESLFNRRLILCYDQIPCDARFREIPVAEEEQSRERVYTEKESRIKEYFRIVGKNNSWKERKN